MTSRHVTLDITREDFEVLVLDPCKFFQSLTRMMLAHMNVARVRLYDEAVPALHDLILEPCDVVIVDADLPSRFSCLKLIKGLKHASLAPLCYIPVIVTSRAPTEQFVTAAARCGAHTVLAKPFSTIKLRERIEWALSDHHRYVIDGGHYVIEGLLQTIEARTRRASMPALSALMRDPAQSFTQTAAVQSMIDKILFPAGRI